MGRPGVAFTTILVVLAEACVPGAGYVIPADSTKCPPPGSTEQLKKVMNPAFVKDYTGCDVAIEAEFLQTGNQGYMLASYDTNTNATFQVVEPGESPQAGPLGVASGTFAGTPKASANLIFEAKKGDRLVLRGGPIPYYTQYGPGADQPVVIVFHATSVKRAP